MLRPLIKLTVTTGIFLTPLLACTPLATPPDTAKVNPSAQPSTQRYPAPLPVPNTRKVTPMPATSILDRSKPRAPDVSNYVARGIASWYSVGAHGAKTASGEVYDLYGMTAAHASLPLYARVKVRNLRTGESAIVTINDRLYDSSVLIKLSYDVARRLELLNSTSNVEVRGLAGDRR